MIAMAVKEAEADQIMMFMGRCVDEMSREELIEVVRALGRELNSSRESHRQTLDVWSMFRKAAP